MVDALQKAKAQLVTKVSVSKKELKDYIASNELDKLDTNKYLTSTADSFKEALKNAQTLMLLMHLLHHLLLLKLIVFLHLVIVLKLHLIVLLLHLLFRLMFKH